MFDRPFRSPYFIAFLSSLFFVMWASDGAVADAAASKDKSGGKQEDTVYSVAVSQWWVAGPLDQRLPALGGAEAGDEIDYAQLLAEPSLPISDLNLSGDGKISGTGDLNWHPVDGPTVALSPDADTARVAWMATRIQTDRFLHATLKVTGDQRFKVFVDGAEVAARTDLAEKKEDPAAKADLQLEAGSYWLVVKTLAEPGAESWSIRAQIEVPGISTAQIEVQIEVPGTSASSAERPLKSSIRTGRIAARGLSLDDLLDVDRYSRLELSPDGRWLAMAGSRPAVPAEHREQWIDIIDVQNGEIVRSLRGEESNFGWLPEQDEPTLFYSLPSKTNDEAAVLYLSRLLGGAQQKVTEPIEHLRALTAMPDGSGWIAEIGQPAEADERGFKRYRALPDRWAGWRDASYFVFIDPSGKRRRLTVGGQSVTLLDIRFDGGAMVLSRTLYGSTERPYFTTELLEVDLGSLEQRLLSTFKWFGAATYSPDGKTLLVTGSPLLFGELGNASEPHTIANEYDTQAYLMPVEDPAAVRALTRDFDPAILGATWSRDDGLIYFEAQDRTWSRMYRFDPQGDGTFVELPSATDTLSEPTVAAGRLAYVGSSPNRPYAVFVQGTDTNASPELLVDPSAERMQDVQFGEVKPWTFTSAAGDEILGRVYYPPNFDAGRTYPLLVYYYGGTVPVDRTFGGRYPKELWAARDYVVYVPQPSGAIGFGQEFSARHVNAWGRRTADEIIEGTRKLLAESEYLDPERVGCLGASYGGFMTMYLQTRTDIFSAAISHAGISNLASYWGKGWWGFLYSAAASAESMPWNNRELYVDQSPLYSADKIQTPLLLLHGDADTNVPPVESHQMYTALKLLGKEVELIEIGGENHTILTYPKRKLWAQTVIAWFDRWLKDQPEAWEHLWGGDEEPKG